MGQAEILQGRELRVSQFLAEAVGGSIAININGSVTPFDFVIKPMDLASGEPDVIVLSRLDIFIRHSDDMTDSGFANSNTGLLNGLRIIKAKGVDLTANIVSEITGGGNTIRNNTDIRQFGGTIDYNNSLMQQGGTIITSLLMTLSFDIPYLIDGANDELFGIQVADDLSGIDTLKCYVHGLKIKR